MRGEWILVNLGTPAAPTEQAVREFLAEFLSDPLVVDFPQWLWRPILKGIVLRSRPAKTAELYQAIWTPAGSPLAAGTKALCNAARDFAPSDVNVSLAYRYGKEERIDRVLEAALERAEEVAVSPLFPQTTASSTGTIDVLVRETAARLGASKRVRMAPLDPVAAGYVEATAERIEAAERRLPGERADRLIISFHGIPARVDRRESGRYSRACEQTTAALRTALDRPAADVVLAYQSRFGPGAWLQPATADVLVERAQLGDRRVVVATPGFLTPGLETIEELGLRGRAAFLDAGGEILRLADPPGDHPLCLKALADSAWS